MRHSVLSMSGGLIVIWTIGKELCYVLGYYVESAPQSSESSIFIRNDSINTMVLIND